MKENDCFRIADLGLLANDHLIGDTDCPGCFRDLKKCKCGSLIHSEVVDVDCDDSVYVVYYCEKCGTEIE